MYIINILLSSAILLVLLQFYELYVQLHWNQICRIINGDAGRGGINETTDYQADINEFYCFLYIQEILVHSFIFTFLHHF